MALQSERQEMEQFDFDGMWGYSVMPEAAWRCHAFMRRPAVSRHEEGIHMNEVIPSPAPRIAAGSWKHLLKVRPRLLGDAELLRRQAKARPELYDIVKGQDTLLSAGVVHVVEGLPAERVAKLIESAMAHVTRGVTNVHQDTWIWMDTVAMVYDLFFDRIAPADRQRMIDWLNPHMEVFKDDENAFHNSTFAKIRTYLRIAYSTWAENPASKAFRDYAIEYLYRGRIVPALKALGAAVGRPSAAGTRAVACGAWSRGWNWPVASRV